MISAKAVAAIAVVVIIVVAAAAYVVVSDDGGNDATVDAIGTHVEVGDFYTIDTQYSAGPNGNPSTDSATYTISEVENGNVMVNVQTSSGSSSETQSEEQFLGEVSTPVGYVGQFQRTETLSTFAGPKVCDIYLDSATVGNSSMGVTVLDWIGKGSNVIYKTEITISSPDGNQIITKTLTDTNMITEAQSGSSGPASPDSPTGDSGIRGDIQVGDYIQYTVYEHGRVDDVERLFVVDIRDGYLLVSEDRYDDDVERMTEEMFLGMIQFQNPGNLQPTGTQTIDTAFGAVACDIYEVRGYESGWMMGLDFDEYATMWVGQHNDVIYLAEYGEYDDRWDDDEEKYELTGTSLFGSSSGTSSQPQQPSTPQAGSFGITLSEGDYYTIQDGRELSRYEVLSVNGNRVTVLETESFVGSQNWWDSDIESMSVDDFLDDFLILDSRLSSMEASGTGSVGSHQCSIYEFRWGDDSERIWVDTSGQYNIVWQQQEMDDREAEVLVGCYIQSAGIDYR